jgi:lipid-A-disaccharide synthase
MLSRLPLKKINLVAGEASGDFLASLLLKGVNQRWPAVFSEGVGGPQMAKEGFHAWTASDRLAVHGLVEALRVYKNLSKFRQELIQKIIQNPPDLFIGVDAPDFNFGLEEKLKNAGIKTIHFVSPSIWAWRKWRIHQISKAVNHVLCLFPFEPEIYQQADIPATFVGHPFADIIPLEPDRRSARLKLNLPLNKNIIALLPGSRQGEINYLTPVFIQTAALIYKLNSNTQFILPALQNKYELITKIINFIREKYRIEIPLEIFVNSSHDVLAACDIALIASGTATLEAALFKRPMVVAYIQHPISHFLMKKMAYLPWISLPNILLKQFAVPELLQNEATPKALSNEILNLLNNDSKLKNLENLFIDLHYMLKKDTSRSSCDVIEKIHNAY